MKKFGMRALVVEPHDVNELIFASYLSHPFPRLPAGAFVPLRELMSPVYRRALKIPIRPRPESLYLGGYRYASQSNGQRGEHSGHPYQSPKRADNPERRP